MHRTITRTGTNSLTLALPAPWVKKNNLLPGQEVEVDEIENRLQVSIAQEPASRIVRIPYDDILFEPMLRKFYLSNESSLLVYSETKIPAIDSLVRKLPGLHILEETEQRVVIERILKPSPHNYSAILRRCYQVIIDGLRHNPVVISPEIDMLLLELAHSNETEVGLLNQISDILSGCATELLDDVWYLLKTSFEGVYNQKYAYDTEIAKRLLSKFKKTDDIFLHYFKQEKNVLVLAKAYSAILLIEKLHAEIMNRKGMEVISRINTPSRAKFKVGVCQVSQANVFWEEIRNSMKKSAESLREIEFVFESALSNIGIKEQDEILNGFLAEGVDAIVYIPINPSALKETLMKINSANIPLIVLDIDLEIQGVNYYYIGYDNYKSGKETGMFLKERLKKNCNVLVIEGYSFGNSPIRIKGFIDALKGYAKISFIKGEFQKSVAYQNTMEFLNKHSVDAIFATNDTMALGAIQAVEQAKKKIPVCGFDMTSEGRAAFQEGRLLSIVNTKPEFQGAIAVEMVHNILLGKKAAERTEYAYEFLTKHDTSP
jgi:ribose transport system substrate-binding protein